MTPKKKYSNPPLIEAVCDFKFADDHGDLVDIQNKIGELVKGVLPVRRERKDINVKIQNQNNQISSNSEERVVMIQYVDETNNRMIQVGQNLLAVNQLKPYKSWEDFLPFVLEMLSKYKEASNHNKLQQVGVRFINHLKIQSSEMKTSDFFNIGISIPEGISTELSNFAFVTEHRYNNGDDIMQIAFRTLPVVKEFDFGFVLDLNYLVTKPGENALEHIEQLLNNAHDVLENIFENALTDECKKHFN